MALTEAEALELANRLMVEAIHEVVPSRPDRTVTPEEVEAVRQLADRRLRELNLSREEHRDHARRDVRAEHRKRRGEPRGTRSRC